MQVETLQSLYADVKYAQSVLDDVRFLGGFVQEAAEYDLIIAYARFDLALSYMVREVSNA